jgi:hypothetical protein
MYWFDTRGQVMVRMPYAGERTEWKTEAEVLAVVGDVVYWTPPAPRDGRSGLHYQLVKGPTAEVIAEGLDAMPSAMTATEKDIYIALYGEAKTGSIVHIENGAPHVVATGQGQVTGMAMLGERVIWAACDEDALLAAGEVIAKFPNKSCPADVLVDGKDIFVATSMDGNVWRVRDGKPTKLGTGDLFATGLSIDLFATGLSVDATHIYWANNGSDGDILRAKR